MTLYILSAGRSGSGWLSSMLVACGLRGTHELTPYNQTDPQFVSDTSLVWNIDSFLKALKVEDSIIVLDRPRAERVASANAILKTDNTWDLLEDQWDRAKALLKETYNDILWLQYEDLFTYTGRSALWHFLNLDCSQERFNEAFEFLKHQQIQNRTAINDVKEANGVT